MLRLVAIACLVAGLVLAGAAGWQVAGSQLQQRRLLMDVGVNSSVMLEHPAGARPNGQPTGSSAPEEPSPVSGEPLFRLQIPRIGFDGVVVAGTSEAALRKGPGLLEGAPLPGGSGNSVVAAHRDRHFWRLGELAEGDLIQVITADGTYAYTVRSRWIVKETDVSVVGPTREPTLTLITCWPIIFAGHTPDRLVIAADRQPSP
ncbi:MAG: class D sortase [Bacillota bacterium]